MKTVFKCDLCKDTEAEIKGESLPESWIEIERDGMLDRSWDKFLICNYCMEQIKRKLALVNKT